MCCMTPEKLYAGTKQIRTTGKENSESSFLDVMRVVYIYGTLLSMGTILLLLHGAAQQNEYMVVLPYKCYLQSRREEVFATQKLTLTSEPHMNKILP